MTLHVKICGITRPEDAIAAVEAGADAIGLVLWRGSPRAIDPRELDPVLSGVPDTVRRVGVFVDADRSAIESVLNTSRLTTAQLHGDQDEEFCRGLSVDWYRAFRVDDATEPTRLASRIRAFGNPSFMLDTRVPTTPGGTGRIFDWRIAAKVSMGLSLKGIPQDGDETPRLILAGGLSPDNVGSAIRQVRPWGVDVSSGVEIAPGRKDADRMRRFIETVRSVA